MRTFALLPRVRVNYSLLDLCKALLTREKGTEKREHCERFLSNFYDGEFVCLTPSARDAIYEVLIRLPQDIVIVPAYTCIAVVEAVLLAGKKIIYSSNNDDFNSSYIECIRPNTIVLATHQYGLPCKIEQIAARCKELGAVLIEDCATSMGTIVNGKKTGTFGDYAVVSFNASKLLNIPPYGGLLISKDKRMLEDITNSAEWKESDFIFKFKGLVRGLAFIVAKNKYAYRCFHYLMMKLKKIHQKSEHEKHFAKKAELYNYKFAEWQASILLRQLQKLKYIFQKRKKLYAYYDNLINNEIIKKPKLDSDAVCCRYAILVEDRENFYNKCIKAGVDLDFSHCSIGCPESFSVEYNMANHVLNIPFDINLSEKESKYVVEIVNSIK